MTRPRMSAPQRRDSILRAATAVFGELGYQRGKVSEIARRTGVTEPVVFQNFGTKAALFAAVLDRAADEWIAGLDAVVRERSVTDALADLLAPGHLDRLHARGAGGVLFADAIALDDHPQVQQAAHVAVARLADALAAHLRHGQAAGDVRADLEADTCAWWLLSLLAGHRFRALAHPGPRGTVEAGIAALTVESLRRPRQGPSGADR